eukprot:SAG11_NODE_35529_length_266_cov_0.622754_1_plen_70_part_10
MLFYVHAVNCNNTGGACEGGTTIANAKTGGNAGGNHCSNTSTGPLCSVCIAKHHLVSGTSTCHDSDASTS